MPENAGMTEMTEMTEMTGIAGITEPSDEAYMDLALKLAERGRGWASPNPMVGAVIVKEGRILGQGYHARCGDLHAERAALAACTEDPRGATLYVTLEPCCHHGRQPPCTEAILAAGIRRVVVGSGDPNPKVAGKGLAMLRAAGVEVREHVAEAACTRLNQVFFHYIRTGLPYVVLKYAMSLDGKIASYTGASQWITGEEARQHVHKLRGTYRAILVGVGTVLADDPLLTCRIEGGRDPLRVICDSHLRTPLTARVIQTAREVPTLLATCETDAERLARYEQYGVQVVSLPAAEGRVSLLSLLRYLGKAQVDSVLVEGGGTLHWSMLAEGLVHKVVAYVASLLLGGAGAVSPVEGVGFPHPDAALRLHTPTVTRLGEDFLVEGLVEEGGQA